MGFFKSLTRRRGTAKPSGPAGYRAYAVGDIHGRLDLLNDLLGKIDADSAGGAAKTLVIFLGDLIDRGPASREVVERLRTLRSDRFNPVFLMGNHEEVLLRLLDGETGLLRSWLRFGGAECARSYGVDLHRLKHLPEPDAVSLLRDAIPGEHVAFLADFHDTFRFGDYLFVHAGIRPGVDLASQDQVDLRWIRAAFLESEADHGFVVVHGHTISRQVDERVNRIGIDTGAYATGTLTALAVEGADRWYITATATQTEQSASLVD